MKFTWPTPAPRVGDPTPPIFHLLALGVGFWGKANFSIHVGGTANLSVFGYQHVAIPYAKLWHWGSKPARGPRQWNVSLSLDKKAGLYRYSDLLRELGVVVYHRPKSSYFHKTVECTYIDRLQMGVVIYHRPIEFFH